MINDILCLIQKCNKEGIIFVVKNDKLSIKTEKKSVPNGVLAEIKKNKQQIISLFKNNFYPLSFSQERLWFIDQHKQNATYNIPLAVRILGGLDIWVLEKALFEIVSRHEVLRTNFVTINNDPKQFIHERPTCNLEIVNLNHLTKEKADKQILSSINKKSPKPFDLANDSLVRFTLYIINENDSVLFLNMHHIISDAWSISILINEISLLYDAFNNGKLSPLKELSIQYADYAVWQKEYLDEELLQKQGNYWKGKLKSVPILELPTFKARPNEQTFSGNRLQFSLDKDLTDKLKQLSKKNDATLFMTLLSAFKILLQKYTGQSDICVGSLIANRTREEIEGLIGFFVNTLALRSDVDPEMSFNEFLKQVKATTLEAYENQEIPFAKVVDIVESERNLSFSPLFQVIMVLQNTPLGELKFSGLNVESLEIEAFESRFDLVLELNETINGIAGRIEYNTDLFEREWIERMIGHFKVLLEFIISNSKVDISDIEILTSAEKQQLLVEWNDTKVDYPREQCIHQLFEEQVEKTPDNVAVVFEEEKLTYRQLNEKANQLGHYLQKKGVKPESLVGICIDRSLDMIVGLLGILKAGGAYVPIDPAYPKERISFMLEDTECRIVLTKKHIEQPITSSEILYLDSDWDKIEIESTENVKSNINIDNVIYVIYTSGSTGRPKGVCVEHRSLSNYLFTIYSKYDCEFSFDDRCLSVCNISFDVSVVEIFLPLIHGSELYIITEKNLLELHEFCDMLINKRITFAYFPPAILEVISTILKQKRQKNYLNKLYVGVEPIKGYILKSYVDINSDIRILNAYGPTEVTISCTSYEFKYGEYTSKNVPIGTPNFNTKSYILDMHEHILPVGVPGELYVGGEQVARGYLKQPGLTKEKFIKNPFSDNPDSRLYKTGDLARYLPDGNIEFLGRIDDQIKIRGFRIELVEIESVLNEQETVNKSVVLVKEDTDGNKQLVAYVVLSKDTEEEGSFNVAKLREELSKTLPDYMVPSLFVKLETMPLTPNGKIDRKALPAPEVKAGDDYMAPSNELEEVLVIIWAKLLNIDKNEVSINKSFFEIGGNSLLTIKLQQKLRQLDQFKTIQVSDIFKYHTINKLVQSTQQDNLLEYKLQREGHVDNHEIAIIDMSGAFSGVNDIDEYWQLIKKKAEGIQFYSKEECEKFGVDSSLLEDPNYIPVAGHVNNIDQFDPLFWDISPNEAKLMDPQIRKFIEHCWFTLESSGYVQQRRDLNIGVFAGCGNNNYFYNNILNGEKTHEVNIWEALTANSKGALATKASYMLGLSGPAYSINTACSTGLVSVVEACKNLQLGTCNMALAGGVTLSMPNQIGYTYQEGMISSKDGHCRTFDEGASGTTGGSGVGVVLLKRLEDAVKDNDNIIGVIKGYASNNDGDRKTDYTAPSITGQAECIINAQRMAGVSSNEINYVECHGSGTNLGDPIEVQALKEAFEFNSLKGVKPKDKTVLGAVKANIGHADSAAGTAGLIKVCLMLQNNIIPGQPNFYKPNPKLNLDQTNFDVSKENREWLPSPDKQRMAAVSSFGIGGTNAHVIVGDYIPNSNKQPEYEESWTTSKKENNEAINYIVPISAKSKESLELYKHQLIQYLTKANDLSIEDLAYTLQERREHFNYRSAYCARDIDELIDGLKQYSLTKRINSKRRNKIVFMFPGQGSQYPCMAKELYDNEQLFKIIIDKLISLANPYLGVNLFDVIFPEEGHIQYDINETKWAQISIFIIEYAFATYLENLGVRPDAYMGHSLGEYVAATLSGVFTLEEAIKIVIARGNLLQTMQAGSMMAINAKEEDIVDIIKEHSCEISLINSLDDLVVSGSVNAIKALKTMLSKQKTPCVILNTSYASHSKMIEHISHDFEKVFTNIKLNKPTKCFISNLTGEIANEEVSTGSYWYRHLRNTVKFAKGVDSISKHYNNQISFIQIGPDDGLCYFVTKYKNTTNYKSIETINLLPSAKKGENKRLKNKEEILAQLWVSGIVEQPNGLRLSKQAKALTGLPTYQFNYGKYWIESTKGNDLVGSLKMLPKKKWLSTPIWSAITNLNNTCDKVGLLKNALVFIRADQLNSIDFKFFAEDIHYIVLDAKNSQTEKNGKSKLLFAGIDNELDFKLIAEYLKTNNIKYDAIIHASSINNVTELEDALNYSFYSLFLIHKYLLNVNHLEKLLVLTNGLTQITNEDSVSPPNGTLVGATRTINHEFPNIDARVIDIGPDRRGIESLINQVIKDETYKKSEELLAVRFGKLWKENFEIIENSIPEVNLIEEGDIILITGGLGGVALAIANYISIKHKVTFILVSRNNIYKDAIPSYYAKQKIKIIEEIRAKGSIVEIQSADISDEKLVVKLKEQIENKYGSIHGIIHTAGVTPLAIDMYDLDNVKNVFKGKVYGIYNIINTFNLNNSKYIVSTSSLASVMGDINRIEYCASNSYLDYLSADKVSLKGIKLLATNWLGWKDIGMMKEASINNEGQVRQLQGMEKLFQSNVVDQREGAEIFYHLINQSNYDQVIITKLDIHDVKNELFIKEHTFPQDIGLTITDGNFTAIEFKLAQIWSQVLGVEEMGINDDFFELGGNSILATRVISKIRTEFNITLPLRTLFEKPDLIGFSKIVENTESKSKIDKIGKAKSEDLFNVAKLGNVVDSSERKTERFKV